METALRTPPSLQVESPRDEGIFDPLFEKINLLLPLPLILISGIEALRGFSVSPQVDSFLAFTAAIVFLNHIHVFFTLLFLGICASGHAWLKAKFVDSSIGYRYLATFLLGISVLYSVRFVPALTGGNGPLIFILVIYLYNLFHNYKQSFGMSLLYNRVRSDRLGRPVDLKLIHWERNVLNLLLFVLLARIVLRQVVFRGPVVRTDPIWLVLGGVGIALSLGLVYLAWYQDGGKFSHKSIYNLRFLLYPMMFYSRTAVFAVLSMHGIEYLLITLKLTAPEWPDRRKALVLGLLLIAMASTWRLLSLEFTARYARSVLNGDRFLINVLMSTSLAFTLLHYYLDGLIFRARDTLNRELFLGPLIRRAQT